MAKGKHATALFEVIHTASRPPKASSTGGIPTPKWWFKSKQRDRDAGGDTDARWSIFSVFSRSNRCEPVVEPPPRIIERIIERPVYIERLAPAAPSMRLAGDSAMSVDRAGGEINFSLSYGGAAAAGFVLILIVAFAYLAGTRSGQAGLGDEALATTQPSNLTAGGAGRSGFLAAISPAAMASPTPQVAQQSAPVSKKPAPTAGASPTPPTPVVTASGKLSRQVGMHYVIAQSYPDMEFAKKACDLLNKAGIPCTVEAGPTGWAVRSWYSVVGLKPFDHVQRNPELEAYKEAIETAGAKLGGARSFNRFEPKLYKWREDTR